MEQKTDAIVITKEVLQGKIYVIREQKVMLDVDLAEIYGYDTKNFNRQVKNNSAKFEGEDFMFQLCDEELEELLRCKNCTLNRGEGRGKHVKYNPFVFTEQGIYMLMTVLRGELAVKQSRALVRTFKRMKDYIIDNRELIGQREYIQLSMQTAENIRDISRLKSDICTVESQMSDVMNQLSEVVTKLDLSDMMNSFVDNKDNIGANKLYLVEYQDFCKEYPGLNISMKTTGGIYHDRFIVLDYDTDDERVFLCGASSKDAGARITSIVEDFGVEKYRSIINGLVGNAGLVLK